MSTAPAPIQSATPEGQQIQQFASKVRAKYPGAYDDIRDADLAQKIVTKHPEYADMLPKAFAAPETQFEQERKSNIDTSGGMLGRTASGIGRGINNLVEGTYQTFAHPIDTAEGIISSTGEHLARAGQEPSTVGKLAELGAAVPMLGPLGQQLGERAGAGDVAGAISEGLTTAAAPSVLHETATAGREAIGRRIYTPEGKLKTPVQVGSRAVGYGLGRMSGIPEAGLAGGYVAPEVVKTLFPNENPPGPSAKIPLRMPKTAPPVDPVSEAIRAGNASRIPTRMPKPAAAPEPNPFPGATSTGSVVSSGTKLPEPSPGSVTSTGPAAALSMPESATPKPRIGKTAGEVVRLPEPTHGDPRWMASVPRGKLPGMAAQGMEGAGQQMQNLGKTVLYTPPEGYPGPRPNIDEPIGQQAPAPVKAAGNRTTAIKQRAAELTAKGMSQDQIGAQLVQEFGGR